MICLKFYSLSYYLSTSSWSRVLSGINDKFSQTFSEFKKLYNYSIFTKEWWMILIYVFDFNNEL